MTRVSHDFFPRIFVLSKFQENFFLSVEFFWAFEKLGQRTLVCLSVCWRLWKSFPGAFLNVTRSLSVTSIKFTWSSFLNLIGTFYILYLIFPQRKNPTVQEIQFPRNLPLVFQKVLPIHRSNLTPREQFVVFAACGIFVHIFSYFIYCLFMIHLLAYKLDKNVQRSVVCGFFGCLQVTMDFLRYRWRKWDKFLWKIEKRKMMNLISLTD